MEVTLSQNGVLSAKVPYCGVYPSAQTTVTSEDVGTQVVCVSITLDSAPNFIAQDADCNSVGVVDWVLAEVRSATAGTTAGEFG